MEKAENLKEKKVLRGNSMGGEILLNSRRLGNLCRIIADHFALKAKQNGKKIDAVVGHPVIASFVAYWLAEKDSSKQDVLAIPANKMDFFSKQGTVGCATIKPNHFRHIRNRTCLVVWDTADPEEISWVCETVIMGGSDIFGVGALKNEERGRVTAEFLGVDRLFCAVNGAK